MFIHTKRYLTKPRKLAKHVVIRGTAATTSRVLTLWDLVTLIKKDVPTAVIGVDPVRTSKKYVIPSWVKGQGLENRMGAVATWDDAVKMIESSGGTINVDLSATGGVALTTTEAKTFPSYHSGTIPQRQRSEFITYAEMTYLMNNSTFV